MFCGTCAGRLCNAMLGTLEQGRPAPQKERMDRPSAPGCQKVVAVFASAARLERDCIRLYAQTHPEICAAAVVPDAAQLLQLLRRGLHPQVLVIDAMLGGFFSLVEEVRALHLDPEPAVLLLAPLPDRTAARRAIQELGNCELLLKPCHMKDLFDQVYFMGVGADQFRLYRIRRCYRRYLQQMQADPAMSGCDYLEQMLLYAMTSERPLSLAALYQLTAQDNDTQEGSIAAAIGRLSRKMQRQGTPVYRDLCRRCGLPETAVLSNGKLLKTMLELLRQEIV